MFFFSKSEDIWLSTEQGELKTLSLSCLSTADSRGGEGPKKKKTVVVVRGVVLVFWFSRSRGRGRGRKKKRKRRNESGDTASRATIGASLRRVRALSRRFPPSKPSSSLCSTPLADGLREKAGAEQRARKKNEKERQTKGRLLFFRFFSFIFRIFSTWTRSASCSTPRSCGARTSARTVRFVE